MANVNEIKQLIAEGKTEEVIRRMLQDTTPLPEEIHEQVVLLSARFEQWRKAERLGMTENNAELNRINAALIDLANTIDEAKAGNEVFTAAAKGGRASKKWSILGIGVVGMILLVFLLLNWPGKDPVENNELKESQQTTTQTHGSSPAISRVESSMERWYSNIQPFGVKCRMTIKSIGLEAKNPETTYVKIQLSVKNEHEGSHEAQLTSNLFLLEADEVGSVTESDLSVIRVLPGETKMAELLFSLPNTAQMVKLIVLEDSNARTVIPLQLFRDAAGK